MLHLDVDLYKPTKDAIMMFVERMPKGGIIVFDELNHPDYPGETTALIDSLGLRHLNLRRVPHPNANCTYLVLD